MASMEVTYITKKIYMVFLLAVLFYAGCGTSGQSEPDPIGIKIKSPKFDEIAGIYTDVTPSLKFTSSSGGVTECNVFIGTDTKVKGTCGDMPFGTYAYNLEYRYQDVSIAKSIGSITIDENNTENPITLLDKNIDEDNDGCSNLQEVIVGSNPLVQDTCIPPPTDLTAKSVSTTRIDLTWTESSGATGYKIFRREGSDGADTEIGTSTQTSYSDTGLNADTTYCYKVSANGNGAESIPTDIVCAKTENGLVAFYPFNGNVNDESGNGNNGTVNGATLTADRFGNADSAYSFDGVNDWIGQNKALSVGNTFTISVWINPLSTHEIDIEGSRVGGTSGQKYVIYPTQGDDIWGSGHAGAGISAGINGVSVYEHAANYMPPQLVWQSDLNSWTHIVVAYNNKQSGLYINGNFMKTGLTSSKIDIHPSNSIGGNSNQGGYGFFKGSIDDIRIYNRALTDAEILTLYNEGK